MLNFFHTKSLFLWPSCQFIVGACLFTGHLSMFCFFLPQCSLFYNSIICCYIFLNNIFCSHSFIMALKLFLSKMSFESLLQMGFIFRFRQQALVSAVGYKHLFYYFYFFFSKPTPTDNLFLNIRPWVVPVHMFCLKLASYNSLFHVVFQFLFEVVNVCNVIFCLVFYVVMEKILK